MRRVFRFGFRRHVEREVDDEITFHLDTRIERLVAGGLSRDDARREALKQFGELDSVRDSCVTLDRERDRAVRRTNILVELRQDLSYAARMLRHNLLFTSVIVGTLALGVGANTAIFTLIDAVLLRALPVRAPQELVQIGNPMRVT